MASETWSGLGQYLHQPQQTQMAKAGTILPLLAQLSSSMIAPLNEMGLSMSVQLGRIIIYTKRLEELVAFYCLHFGFEVLQHEGDRIVELISQGTGTNILLHPMSQGRKEGQTLVKLVFDVEDVEGFCRESKERGLLFGPIQNADGYSFANTKDPAKNSVSISSRAFVKR